MNYNTQTAKGNKAILYKIFFALFGVLYMMTAFISFLHAIEFFSIGNELWMSYVLSAVFEIGQMSVLMSLLVSENNKKTLPWFLMLIFTSVQVISNVYSVTKYIMLSEVEYYKYLERALKFAIQDVPQDMIVTVIAWIIGGLLPICALLLTAMCASQISIIEEKKGGQQPDDVITPPSIQDPEIKPLPEQKKQEEDEMPEEMKEGTEKKKVEEPKKESPAPAENTEEVKEEQKTEENPSVFKKLFRRKHQDNSWHMANQGYYRQPEEEVK